MNLIVILLTKVIHGCHMPKKTIFTTVRQLVGLPHNSFVSIKAAQHRHLSYNEKYEELSLVTGLSSDVIRNLAFILQNGVFKEVYEEYKKEFDVFIDFLKVISYNGESLKEKAIYTHGVWYQNGRTYNKEFMIQRPNEYSERILQYKSSLTYICIALKKSKRSLPDLVPVYFYKREDKSKGAHANSAMALSRRNLILSDEMPLYLLQNSDLDFLDWKNKKRLLQSALDQAINWKYVK